MIHVVPFACYHRQKISGEIIFIYLHRLRPFGNSLFLFSRAKSSECCNFCFVIFLILAYFSAMPHRVFRISVATLFGNNFRVKLAKFFMPLICGSRILQSMLLIGCASAKFAPIVQTVSGCASSSKIINRSYFIAACAQLDPNHDATLKRYYRSITYAFTTRNILLCVRRRRIEA